MSLNDIKSATFIAYKSILRGNRSTILLMIFILSLSFINMMFISGIMNGFAQMVPQMFIDDVSSHVYITPQEKPNIKGFIVNQTNLRYQIAAVSGVIATARRYDLAGSVSFDKDKSGQSKTLSAGITGVDPIDDAQTIGTIKHVRYGSWLDPSDTDQIILSSALGGGYGETAPADLGGVKVGDKVIVTYSNGLVRTYTVKGIWHDNMDMLTSFVTTKEAESVLDVSDSASRILVKADLNKHPLDYYVQKIQELAPNLKVHSYIEALGTFKGVIGAINLVGVIVSVISIAVAAITIFILIYVNAISNRKQIGILKAIGIKQRIIVFSYVLQAFFYVIISVTIGSVVVFGVLYPYFLKYPIDADIGTISLFYTATGIVTGTISFVIAGLLSGWLPSRAVTRLEILKAIWG